MLSPLRPNVRLSLVFDSRRAAFMLIFVLVLLPLLHARQVLVSRQRRGVDVWSSGPQLIGDQRLGSIVQPTFYNLSLVPCLEQMTFTGRVGISLLARKSRDWFDLHAHPDLMIQAEDISLHNVDSGVEIPVRKARFLRHQTVYAIRLNGTMEPNGKYRLDIRFAGKISDSPEGMFKGMYFDDDVESNYLATNLRPNYARLVFPCFDEPAFKTPFNVTILRPHNYRIQFNSPLNRSYPISPDKVLDHFQVTVPMSTFSFGFVMSTLPVQLSKSRAPGRKQAKPVVRIIGRKTMRKELAALKRRVARIMYEVHKYLDDEYPLFDVLNIVALPDFEAPRPIYNWNVLVFEERDIIYYADNYRLAQELISQWFGTHLTATWWSDAPINQAIVELLATQITLDIANGTETTGTFHLHHLNNWHSPTANVRTKLMLRMFNHTIGSATFRNALRQLFMHSTIANRPQHLRDHDVWTGLSAQAHADGTLAAHMQIGKIANAWIQQDRLPVVTVKRDYEARTARVTQREFLRGQPHDEQQNKMLLWWIPVVVVRQDRLDFANATPTVWMQRERKVLLTDLPGDAEFVIVNPEEIGPYLVNYDLHNWNLLSDYLLTAEGRQRIPVYTRAKLVHDAWHLALAGDLNFATALNMTLFLRHEREELVWKPVFHVLEMIKERNDMAPSYKQLEWLVAYLLTDVFKEFEAVIVDNEENWWVNLGFTARVIQCMAGYRPCVLQARAIYQNWMKSDNFDDIFPVPDHYLCPMFLWGHHEEWEFGLQRFINLPDSRERHFLLRCLAGCPVQKRRTDRLLNFAVMEDNLTDDDIELCLDVISSSTKGNDNLFRFVMDNWDEIRDRLRNRTHMWDKLISSATGKLTTDEGYSMLEALYEFKSSEFGSAEPIIDDAWRTIKEKVKWSEENLSIIRWWMDIFFDKTNVNYRLWMVMGNFGNNT